MPGTDMPAAPRISKLAAPPMEHTWPSRLQALLFTAGAQAGIQMLGIVTGLVVVRMLPLREYAYYTIASGVLGTMTVLTDSGVSQSVLAQGGLVWRSPSALGSIVSGGLLLRRRFAAIAAVISLPVLFLLLRQQGASLVGASLVSASILPLFFATVTGQLVEVVPRLHQALAPLQGIQLSAAVIRFVTTVGAVALLPLAWLAGLGAGLGQLWATWRLTRLAGVMADLSAPADRDAQRVMIRQVGRTAPSAIYYAFAGQITVWLISVFGSTSAVAQVGALTRLAMAYAVVTAVFTVMVVPRFARAQLARYSSVVWHFWRAQLTLIGLLSLVVLVVAAFPGAALKLLGHDYALLTREVVLVAAAGAVSTLSGAAYALAAARGVVAAPWVVVPYSLMIQAALVASLPIATVSGVLWLGVLSNLGFWLLHAVNFTWSVMYKR